ncbi:spore coat protein SP96-like [Physella acuta]|uniref:spore coat protein SP96-like n=1 Tax=Physella acuta TaxID=109671 RepID=UPI0027DAE0C4|nr:spore coat protein SP96-like [Physella acuta]
MATSLNYQETPETKLNPWKFSNCSASYFSGYVSTLLQTVKGTACLTTLLNQDSQIPDTSGQLLGQLYPPSEQCVMLYGNNSYDCRLRNPSEYCRNMYCSDGFSNLCYMAYALEGTTCGSGKLCKGGDCVTDAAAPIVDEDCVFGDESRKIFSTLGNKTCASLVQTSKLYCYQDSVFKLCCATCKAVKRNVPGCEYGDTFTGCTASSCSIQENLAGCCETCNYTAPITTAATTPSASSLATTTITISTTTSKSTAASTSSLTQTTGSTPPTQVSTASTSTAATASTSTAATASTSTAATVSTSTAATASTSTAATASTSTAATASTSTAATASTSTAATVSTSDAAVTATTASPTGNNTTTLRPTTTEAIVCVDTTGSVMDNMSCSDIAEKNIGYCYLAMVHTQCCSTCGRAASGVKGCEYGDREPTACALVNACQTTPELCCQTCNSGRQTASGNSLSVVSAGIFLFVVHIVTPEW